ncbi:GSU2403 family nucleotidyltransferase fold protein [Methylobacterium sp. NEAU 140]|uniref:nucleotidyltransferase family protein n=1 Tax=Methylobacterium sp. NEAU 140 TaxID=3064945 RepID=UPI0027329FE5|nr:GSU2403 family nucleotidyltransferase fold protein [Methylobacterium sp. NEAU 140]MDP4021253.1 GSU2403 family nucleotidyltransferase fold protein [Methylobacterium sp. NEAU 140]
MREIDLAYRTLFAELAQRCLDGAFETDCPLDGRFVTVPVKGRAYWYFDRPTGGRVRRSYVGPQDDPEIARRVATFREIKDDLRARRKLVATLTREAGLPAAERFTGDVVQSLAEAGLFRLRGVLVGTVAFQCYPGVLGMRFPGSALQTGDADFAQFHSISAAVGDAMPPVLETLRRVDATFREIPHTADGRRTTKFRNARRYEVEFLTPNRGSADYAGRPADMPALGGASAEPLRFFDFLIYQPVRSVLLHRNGVGVVVPAPERYAVHKLIVAHRRRDDAAGRLKRDKDALQAAVLSTALIETRRADELAGAFAEAWDRGPAWRHALRGGLAGLPTRMRTAVVSGLAEGLQRVGEDPAAYRLDGYPASSDIA